MSLSDAFTQVLADYKQLGVDLTTLGSLLPTPNLFTLPYPFPASRFANPSPSSFPNGAAMIAKMVATFSSEYGGVGVNFQPITRVPAAQPAVPLGVNPGANDFTPNTGKTIQLPSNLILPTSSDAPMICEVLGVSVTELWETKLNGPGYNASWGGKLSNLSTSSGIFPYNYGRAASGISYRATQITQNDLLSGAPSADHVISFQVGNIDNKIQSPANRTDGGSNPGYLYYGLVLKLPTSISMPTNMAPFAQFVFRSLQSKGAIVMDQTQESGQYVVAEDSADWKLKGMTGTDPITASLNGQPEYSVLSQIPWAQLQVFTI